ncbi:hypothetical protein YC2023_009543 [Brassica napus]
MKLFVRREIKSVYENINTCVLTPSALSLLSSHNASISLFFFHTYLSKSILVTLAFLKVRECSHSYFQRLLQYLIHINLIEHTLKSLSKKKKKMNTLPTANHTAVALWSASNTPIA